MVHAGSSPAEPTNHPLWPLDSFTQSQTADSKQDCEKHVKQPTHSICLCSSVEEQVSPKDQVGGSNPSGGTKNVT